MAGEGKVALITGAGSGIGQACVLAFLKNGYRVGLVGRRPDALAETVKLGGGTDANTISIPTDVADPKALNAAFDKVAAKFGRIDVVFNNAGVGAPAVPLEDLPLEEWHKVVNTNLSGVFYGVQAAFRIMKAQNPQGGRIINNGSISAHAPRPNSIAYTATKHGVTGITKTASLDGRKYNIAVGQIDVGNAATAMGGRMAKGVPQANGEIAVEAVMDVHHVADTVLCMAQFPLETNILNVTVMATKMPFVGRG